jgi:AAA+ ATPase superfamily predicted ATPase
MFIGRERETGVLKEAINSERAEFVAVWGRRRVGKTYMIEQVSEKSKGIFFSVMGLKNGKLAEQLELFTREVSRVFYNQAPLETPRRWLDMFALLTDALQKKRDDEPIILFLDELPWMDSRNSKLLQYLDYYWNQFWSKDKRIKLIICGSAASWMVKKVIKAKGGLHNRVTQTIRLNPFTLKETKAYLEANKIKLSLNQVLQIYMCIGGIPFYLSKLKKGLSSGQNIEQLAFVRDGFLLGEFDNLFSALFDYADSYVEVVKKLAKSRSGIGKTKLLKMLGKEFQGKKGLEVLDNLEESGFIQSFVPHFHKKQGIYYRVIDEYVMFYLTWIEPIKSTLSSSNIEAGYWLSQKNHPAWHVWVGYAFESVCYKHLSQIRKGLQIQPNAIANSWRYVPRAGGEERGAQIDLLFDRPDGVITVCEIKYSEKPFVVDKAVVINLLNKVEVFQKKTGTNKDVFIALITSSNLKETQYASEYVSGHLSLENFLL